MAKFPVNRSLFIIRAFLLLNVLLLGGKLVVGLPFLILHLCLLDLVCQGRYGVALVLLLGDNFQGVDAQGDL